MAKVSGSVKTKRFVTNSIVHIILTIFAVIWIIPILWIIFTSFRATRGAYSPSFIPETFSFNNYKQLFKETDVINFPRMFLNTFVISIFSCLISTLFILSVAYCMSRLRFKMRRPFMRGAMILTMFPGFMSMMAVYFILKALKMSEGVMIIVALVIVYSAGSGLTFYVSKGFFDTIPMALDEAAMLDGCTKWQIFTKVTIPLSAPIIVYTVLQSFLAPWLDFIFARVIARANTKYYTVALGMWKMLEKEYVDRWYTSFCAAAVIISIPIIILFYKMQKFYAEGITGGAVKG